MRGLEKGYQVPSYQPLDGNRAIGNAWPVAWITSINFSRSALVHAYTTRRPGE
jgi:hypothetical protein